MALRDQDLQYLIRVADAELREATKLVRTLNKEMGASERVAGKSSASTSGSYQQVEVAAGRSMKAIAGYSAGIVASYLTIDKGVEILHTSVREAGQIAVQIKNVEATFTSAADGVLDWSKGTTDSIFVAKRDALEFANAFGAVLKSVDIAPSRSAELSRTLVEVAGGLALIKGQEPGEVVDRLKTALIGRTGGVRQYAISLTKARIEQQALAMTGKRDAAALTDQEKVLARIELILQQTVTVQGAAAELADEHAGQTRKLNAELKDLEGNLGALLIPTLTEGAASANALFDALEAIGELKDIAVRVKVEAGEALPGLPDLPGVDIDLISKERLLGPVNAALLGLVEKLVDARAETAGFGDELSNIGRAGAAVSDVGADIAEVAAQIEAKLRTRLGDALEDVHDKALTVFDRETDALLSAHDRVTDNILDAFDTTTAEMVERMRVLVKVGEQQFEIGRDQLTPAERELEALEKIDRKRNLGREELDAREALGLAQLIGDPHAIRDAQRRVQDVETERKRIKLQARAETEREAADKALEAEEETLRDSRDAQRDSLAERRRLMRTDLAARRRILRDNLDQELKEIQAALVKQKVAAGKAQQRILDTLRKYGAEYKGVGAELGGKFLEGFAGVLEGVLAPKLKPPKQIYSEPRGPGGVGAVPRRRKRIEPRSGFYLGGVAGRPGRRGATDTIPAWLTPGEMVLTGSDQAQLARMLGTSTTGEGLLSMIRTGFAQGGIADEGLLRELLERFSRTLSEDAVSIGTSLVDPRFLTGATDAERRRRSPVHIQALVRDTLTEAQEANLGRGGRLKLMGELAQRQAHPGRAGLVRTLPAGAGIAAGGGHFRDPGSGDTIFGDISASFPNVKDGYEAFEEIRRMAIKHTRRNVRRRRGRNKGRDVW